MNFIHPTFKTAEVLNFVATLITDYDYKNYNDLSHADKCEFVSLLIEPEGHEFIAYEMRDSLKKIFNTTSYKDEEDYLFDLKEIAIKYYNETMQNIFNYTHQEYIQERNAWKNEMAKYGDSDTNFNEVTL